MGRTVRLVLSQPGYLAFAAVAAGVALTVFVVSQNVALVADVVVGGSLPPANRVAVLAGLYPFAGTSFDPATGTAVVAVAVLAGVDLALVAYHLREHRLSLEGGGAGAVGAVLGALGAGCGACGSAVLAGLLSLVGATASLTLLPLDGFEFVLLALGALVLSIHWMAEGLRGGEIAGCPVDP